MRLAASFCFAFGTALLLIPLAAGLAAEPELPRVFLDTTYIEPSGGVIAVAAGDDLQAALDQAQPGQVIELQAGATFIGNFTLPNKTGTEWVYIRSSAHTGLPPPGRRVSPLDAPLMPKIESPNTLPAIRMTAGAHHYRFVGIEITTTHSVTTSTNFALIDLKAAEGQTSLSQVPTDIVFDRCYIHGTPTGNIRRGIALNSARTAIIDSYLSDFHEVVADSQAIGSWNSPGPFKIVNNYLEGAGENVMFGGADPTIPDLVPSDIEIRHNHFFKPLSWKFVDTNGDGLDDTDPTKIHWAVKNLFELKNAQRVLVEGNIFENNWVDSQAGYAILFTVRNQEGRAPWSAVQDVTFTKNIIRHSNGGVSITGTDDVHASQRTKRILIKDNLIDDLDASKYGTDSSCNKMFQLLNIASPDPGMPGGILDLNIDHNTGRISGICTAAVILGDSTDDFNKHENFVFQNNLVQSSVSGSGTPEGTGALTTYTKPGYIFVKNVLIGRSSSLYPPDNFFPATDADVGFVDLAGGDFRLSLSSPYNNAGTDGKDIGADFDALILATASVIEGTSPADATPPVISAVAVPLITSSDATITWLTDEPSDSQVEYGTTAVYGSSTTLNTTLVISHSQTLSGLSAGTLYHYRVKSKDAAGNLAVSLDQTFTTLDTTPPVRSGGSPSGTLASGTTETTISLTTDESATCRYSTVAGVTYASMPNTFATTGGTSHSTTVTGLTGGTAYTYYVRCQDAAGNANTDDFTISFNVNQAPTVNAGADQIITLPGSAALMGMATDDGQPNPPGVLTTTWSQVSGPGTVTFSDVNALSTTATFLNGGLYVLRLTVSDGEITVSDDVAITVNHPPDCAGALTSLSLLWPPNHKLVAVSVVGVIDPDNDPVRITITKVTQDEPVSGLGAGDASPDAVIRGDTVDLRAERSDTGNGRVYQVHFTAEDGWGGACSRGIAVGVPKDMTLGATVIDDGQLYDSTLP